MLTPEKIQVLILVLQRAPITLAEQIICQEVLSDLQQIVSPQPQQEEAPHAD